MRVYIATALENVDAAREWSTRLQDFGHEVVSRWHAAELLCAPDREHELTPEQRDMIATSAFADLDEADVVLFLDHPECQGTLLEIGYALGSAIPTIGIGSAHRASPTVDYCVDGFGGGWIDPARTDVPAAISRMSERTWCKRRGRR